MHNKALAFWSQLSRPKYVLHINISYVCIFLLVLRLIDTSFSLLLNSLSTISILTCIYPQRDAGTTQQSQPAHSLLLTIFRLSQRVFCHLSRYKIYHCLCLPSKGCLSLADTHTCSPGVGCVAGESVTKRFAFRCPSPSWRLIVPCSHYLCRQSGHVDYLRLRPGMQ